ncbi:MAG: hypothetical protein ACREF5_01285 [Candidatus Saccharimonadales bacterium]
MIDRLLIQKVTIWHKTKRGYLIFAIVELAIAYVIVTVAINVGNLWLYVLTVILLTGVIQNLVKLLGNIFYGHKSTKA